MYMYFTTYNFSNFLFFIIMYLQKQIRMIFYYQMHLFLVSYKGDHHYISSLDCLSLLLRRKAKKKLPGGSKYLTSTSQDITVRDSDVTNDRTVLQEPRERSGIDSYVGASYVDDDEFDEPLYTNRVGLENGQAMASFTNPYTYHTNGAEQYEEDTTNMDEDESQDGVEGIYVNEDVLRHLAGGTKPPNRRIKTIDPRQTYVNTGDISRDGPIVFR